MIVQIYQFQLLEQEQEENNLVLEENNKALTQKLALALQCAQDARAELVVLHNRENMMSRAKRQSDVRMDELLEKLAVGATLWPPFADAPTA